MSRFIVVVFFSVMVTSLTHAQGTQGAYPTKPVRWLIPYAPGGGTDVVARPIALKLGEVLGQPIVYENRGGGNGLIAGELVAKSTGTESDFSLNDRVFHQKFGYGHVTKIDGNKLTIAFDKAGEKKVVDSFVERV